MSGISIVPDITHDLSGRVEELEAENKRLRKALEGIAAQTIDGYNEFYVSIAEQALKGLDESNSD